MARRTSETDRRKYYQLHQEGKSYAEIADLMGVSRECVRYWCRRQNKGGQPVTPLHRPPPGILSRFPAIVGETILKLRVEHEKWGPGRIQYHLGKETRLAGEHLPCQAQIGRYLHQFEKYRRSRKPAHRRVRPHPASQVHQRWELDFKMGIVIHADALVNLHSIWDPCGETCLKAMIYPAGVAGHAPTGVSMEQVRQTLRSCFAAWNTLPDEIQTDGESTLSAQRRWNDFPTRFTLWLTGLAITHRIIRTGQPTDNAHVEHGHRTLMDYAIRGQQGKTIDQLQQALNQAVHELTFDLPSHARHCHGKAPLEAHPELLQARVALFGPLTNSSFSIYSVSIITWPLCIGSAWRALPGKSTSVISVITSAPPGQSIPSRLLSTRWIVISSSPMPNSLTRSSIVVQLKTWMSLT